MSLDMSQTVVLILVIGMLAALVTLVIRQIKIDNRNVVVAPRFKIGEVKLTEQGVNYLVGRMRDRILTLEDENERLRRELRISNERVWRLMGPFAPVVVNHEKTS